LVEFLCSWLIVLAGLSSEATSLGKFQRTVIGPELKEEQPRQVSSIFFQSISGATATVVHEAAMIEATSQSSKPI
jgi:hypothetical protein